jgi:hypothetical protein
LKNLKKNTFFMVFLCLIKAYTLAIALYTVGESFSQKDCEGVGMRANRVLVAKGWYWVFTDTNNWEGVFQSPWAVRKLRTVLRDEDGRVSFYINAADGVAVILLCRRQLTQKPFQF